jgi:hypothetical protein
MDRKEIVEESFWVIGGFLPLLLGVVFLAMTFPAGDTLATNWYLTFLCLSGLFIFTGLQGIYLGKFVQMKD